MKPESEFPNREGEAPAEPPNSQQLGKTGSAGASRSQYPTDSGFETRNPQS
jgi:hypothetical protein